jgi:manganese/zinc/iron transport system substrate-binding protein
MLWLAIMMAGCAPSPNGNQKNQAAADASPLRILTTTGMVRDMVLALVGPESERGLIAVRAIMGPGVDPHLYQPNRGDSVRLLDADIVVYHGLHLEGRLGDVLRRRTTANGPSIAVGELLPTDQLLSADAGVHDPHVWMDVSLWSQAVARLAEELSPLLGIEPSILDQRVADYQAELAELDRWGQAAIDTIPQRQRILVTAHDAFQYFGRRYGLAVHGVQGVSTLSESAISDINRLVDLMVENKVPAIFFETSVSRRQVEAIVEGAQRKQLNVSSDWSLFSDSMGAEGTSEGTYLGMMKHNFTTITKALGGDPESVVLPATTGTGSRARAITIADATDRDPAGAGS